MEIAEPIRYHHKPENATDAKDIASVVALAAAMSETYGLNGTQPDLSSMRFDRLLRIADIDETTALGLYDEARQAAQSTR